MTTDGRSATGLAALFGALALGGGVALRRRKAA